MPPPYCYDYPRPAVTVDLVVFARVDDEVRVLMIKRKHDPFAGSWALPGGFLDMGETAEAAAVRELKEETGLADPGPIAFLGAFDAIDRDPRGRTISLAYAAILKGGGAAVIGGDDASEAAWLHPRWLDRQVRGARGLPPLHEPELAFDHVKILDRALYWLSTRIWRPTIILDLLPPTFGVADLEQLADQIGPQSANRSMRAMLQAWQRQNRIVATLDDPDRYRRADPDEPPRV